jgi:hypothetical protein
MTKAVGTNCSQELTRNNPLKQSWHFTKRTLKKKTENEIQSWFLSTVSEIPTPASFNRPRGTHHFAARRSIAPAGDSIEDLHTGGCCAVNTAT